MAITLNGTTGVGTPAISFGDATIQTTASINIPTGSVIYFTSTTAPIGWEECDGLAITTALGYSYTNLRNFLIAAGNPFGVSGSDPKLPDLRGEFIRGWDDGRSIDSGRTFGSWQKGSLIAFDSTVLADTVVGVTNLSGYSPENQAKFQFGYDQIISTDYLNGTARYSGITGSSATIAAEPNNFGSTRPRNLSLLPCIKL